MKTNALATLKDNTVYLASKSGLKVKEHSPEILLVSGVLAILGGVVLACKATLKADEILEEHEEKMDTIQQACEVHPTYEQEHSQQDKVAVYVRTIGKFAMNYAPAVACITTGIIAICASHGIMKKRNAALMAAYQAVDLAFKQYRERVVKEFGQAQDMHYLTGGQYKVEDQPDGTQVVKEVEPGETPDKHSYDKFFDESSCYWKKDADANLRFLLIAQNQLNNKLQHKGYVFLNEVYAALDIPPTPAGQIVGWVKTPSSFIDLGIFDVTDEQKRKFVNGYERSIRIHPNVQGIIYDLI